MTLRALILLFTINLVVVNYLQGQNTYTIRAISSITDKPIYEASILIRDSLYTKSNFLGYFQVVANQNDTLLVKHPDYEPEYIILPSIPQFQVLLDLRKELLEYSLGLDGFYRELQKSLKYPKKALTKRLQVRMFIELKIDSLGKVEVYSEYIPEHQIFMNEVARTFKELPGNWSKEYSGKALILPILFRISSMPPEEIYTYMTPKNKIILSEVVVTSYK